MVALRHAVETSGITKLIINKLDVLSGLSQVGIVDSYNNGTVMTEFPSSADELASCKAEVSYKGGWSEDISLAKSFKELPPKCQSYIESIEAMLGRRVYWIGHGKNRSSLIARI